MGVNLSEGAITKILKDRCSSNDLKPVVQVTDISSDPFCTSDDKQWYLVVLSDGSVTEQIGFIAADVFISINLHKGSIVRLTKYVITDEH
nr:nucleic acid-binding, OB-fold [Tanacetum cinerariifolium]